MSISQVLRQRGQVCACPISGNHKGCPNVLSPLPGHATGSVFTKQTSSLARCGDAEVIGGRGRAMGTGPCQCHTVLGPHQRSPSSLGLAPARARVPVRPVCRHTEDAATSPTRCTDRPCSARRVTSSHGHSPGRRHQWRRCGRRRPWPTAGEHHRGSTSTVVTSHACADVLALLKLPRSGAAIDSVTKLHF